MPYLVLAGALVSCGGDIVAPPPPGNGTTPPPGQASTCVDPVDVTLAPGAHVVVDPASGSGCVRFPAAAAGAEYLYAAVATNGREMAFGSSVSYELRGAPVLAAGVAATGAAATPSIALDSRLGRFGQPSGRSEFHAKLRERERVLSTASSSGSFNFGRSGSAAIVPPVLGSQRTFQVCSTPTCDDFVNAPATARFVGQKSAIYTDDVPPVGGGYSQATIDSVGFLFDNYLYPIDTTSFGRESDLDNNGVVVVLLTKRVNELSPNCTEDESVILGYFFGNDLLPGREGSNAGEVFYGLVPDPNNAGCRITETFAGDYLAPTFIHEFQHMISFNQHVLIAGGVSEDTWLNEGLSHFAEELGGRLIDLDAYCGGDCFSRFAVADASNAYEYLFDVESHFAIEPFGSGGTLEERGANWLLVRWLVDHFGADSTGAAFTRSLVATSRLGAANVAAATGVPFSTLVPEWQLANYLDDLPGFVAASPRLQYESWNFRRTYGSFNEQFPGDFPRPYPLVPDTTIGAYAREGTLRAGSGRHLRVVQPAGAGAVTLHLTDATRQAIGGSAAAPRVGIVRIR